MENYSLLMGAAAVMKMAVEMAAVSMEKPSGHFPVQRRRDSVPLADGGGSGSSGDEDGGGDGSGVDGEAFGGTSPSGGVRNRDSCPPDLGFAMAAALEGTRGGGRHHKAIAWPHPIVAGHPLSQTLAAHLLHLSRSSEAPPEFSIATATRRRAPDSRRSYYFRCPRNGEKDVVFINTERVTDLEADLQKRFEHHDPHELVNELKAIFETHAAVECYEASKHFFSCMMEEGSSVSEHMLTMTGHAKKLSDLGIVIPNRLGINRVLQSLPPSYKNFVMNYNMQNMNKELPELFAMLKSAEIEIKKEHQVLMVNKTTSFKKQGKSKGRNKKGGKKAATPL
ncbi:hypothetical protein QYE76_019814 [Lolium multiflorum]|uniref:Uncharacterized protein n=1 Tax=Lolium multiflorum TaxID=4521 RepID=A0AAD8VNI1_LOLMU|nr:hypothetical protein QYE76_019814 [Lolium multiflorum]